VSWGSDLKAKNTTMFEYARREDPPGLDAALQQGTIWYDCLYYFAQTEFSQENMDFLRRLEAFKGSPSNASGKELYKWSGDNMNLSGAVMRDLGESFGDDADADAAVDGTEFDTARGEAYTNLTDTYSRFTRAVAALQEEFPAE